MTVTDLNGLLSKTWVRIPPAPQISGSSSIGRVSDFQSGR